MAKKGTGWLTALALVTIMVTVALLRSDGSSPNRAESTTQRAAADALQFSSDGRVDYPTFMRARIESINARISRCMVKNGAKKIRVPMGFEYDDPGKRAATACQALLDESDALTGSSAMRDTEIRMSRAMRYMRECVTSAGPRGVTIRSASSRVLAGCVDRARRQDF